MEVHGPHVGRELPITLACDHPAGQSVSPKAANLAASLGGRALALKERQSPDPEARGFVGKCSLTARVAGTVGPLGDAVAGGTTTSQRVSQSVTCG